MPDREDTLREFRQRIANDAAAGRVGPLSHYLADFPELTTLAPTLILGDVAANDAEGGFGQYEILRELGRGGQAVVYLAEDPKLGRKVALKVMLGMGAIDEKALARFRREADLTSRLEHPGICSVYDLGVHEGAPWIAMQYVEGRTLAELIREGDDEGSAESLHFDFSLATEVDAPAPKTTEEPSSETSAEYIDVLGRLVERIAHCLHEAHENGVVHRDLKPGNIMVNGRGEPVVLDFGLAAVESDDAGLTLSSDMLGTPAYMAPEQIESSAELVDRRVDVYALGVTLYEGLTRRRPFQGATRQQLFRAILAGTPTPPRRLNPAISGDLQTVVLTAMSAHPNGRYQTALDLAEDLRRVREREPIRAKPAGPWTRTLRWVQRKPGLAALIALSSLLLVLAAGLGAYGVGAAGRAEAEERLKDIRAAERDAEQAERMRLEQSERDVRLSRELEELSSVYGMLTYGVRTGINPMPVVSSYLASYRHWGLDLESPEVETLATQAIAETEERDERMARVLIDGLYELRAGLEAVSTDDKEWQQRVLAPSLLENEAELERLRRLDRTLARLGRSCEFDPDFQNLNRLADEIEDSGPAILDPYLTRKALTGKSPEYCGYVAGLLARYDPDRERAFSVLEIALEEHPGSLNLNMARGGYELAEAAAGRELDREQVKVALRHFELAIAIRPDFGPAYSLLAASLAMSGKFREAYAAIDRAVQKSPDSSLAWFMHADFYARSPRKDVAIASCRRCLEIDPDFARARTLLERLTETGDK